MSQIHGTTLSDDLHIADCMEIDGDHFVRHFHITTDGLDEDEVDPVIVHVEYRDCDGDLFEWFMTQSELDNATLDPKTNVWTLADKDATTVELFRIAKI